MKRWTFAAAVLAALHASAGAQTLVRVRDGATFGFQAGWTLATAGQLTGSTIAEVAIGCTDSIYGAGTVQIVDPTNNTLFRTHTGEGLTHAFGSALSGGWDVDGDGTPDLIVGAPGYDVGTTFDNRGRAYVYSGATGTALYTMTGLATYDQFGYAVALLGDLTGDGRSEFAVGAPGASPGGNFAAGTATVHSGATGAPLFTYSGTATSEQLGAAVARVGDVNGDGIADFGIGAPGHTVNGGAGRVTIHSGATGAVLHTLDGAQGAEHFGTTIAGIADVNGDSVADFTIGSPDYDASGLTDAGRAIAVSGATGIGLWQVNGPYVYMKAGFALSRVTDLNGDGIDDVLVGMPYLPP